MALSPELNADIEKQIVEIKKGNYHRTGMSINNFLSAYSKIFAQLTKDITKLIEAGLNSSRTLFYEGYLEYNRRSSEPPDYSLHECHYRDQKICPSCIFR